MPRTVANADHVVELKPLKCAEPPSESRAVALQEISPEAQALVKDALESAHLDEDEAADIMGISHSLFVRQLQNRDNQHLSLQRLLRLPDDFWLEFVVLIAKRRRIATVRTQILVERVN